MRRVPPNVPSGVPPRRWVAGPTWECHSPGGLCPEGVEEKFPGAGEMRTSRPERFIRARRHFRYFAPRFEHVRAGERERAAPRAPRAPGADFLQRLERALRTCERLGRRSAQTFAAGLGAPTPPGFSPISFSYAVLNETPGHIAPGCPPARGRAPRVGSGLARCGARGAGLSAKAAAGSQ